MADTRTSLNALLIQCVRALFTGAYLCPVRSSGPSWWHDCHSPRSANTDRSWSEEISRKHPWVRNSFPLSIWMDLLLTSTYRVPPPRMISTTVRCLSRDLACRLVCLCSLCRWHRNWFSQLQSSFVHLQNSFGLRRHSAFLCSSPFGLQQANFAWETVQKPREHEARSFSRSQKAHSATLKIWILRLFPRMRAVGRVHRRSDSAAAAALRTWTWSSSLASTRRRLEVDHSWKDTPTTRKSHDNKNSMNAKPKDATPDNVLRRSALHCLSSCQGLPDLSWTKSKAPESLHKEIAEMTSVASGQVHPGPGEGGGVTGAWVSVQCALPVSAHHSLCWRSVDTNAAEDHLWWCHF